MIDTAYTDKVVMDVLIPDSLSEKFRKQVTEATGGRADINMDKAVYYGLVDGKAVIF